MYLLQSLAIICMLIEVYFIEPVLSMAAQVGVGCKFNHGYIFITCRAIHNSGSQQERELP